MKTVTISAEYPQNLCEVSAQLSSTRERIRNVWSAGKRGRGWAWRVENLLPHSASLRRFLWANCIKHPKHPLYRQLRFSTFPSSRSSCQCGNQTCIASKKRKSLRQKGIGLKRHVNQKDLAANSIS